VHLTLFYYVMLINHPTKIKLSIIFIFLLVYFKLSIASETPDSLMIILSEPEKHHDTILYRANYLLAWQLKSIKPDIALIHAEKALHIAEKIQDVDKIADALAYIGVIHWQSGNFDKALDYHLESNGLFNQTKNENGIAKSLTNIGIVFTDQGQYEKALEFYFKALTIYSQINNNQGMATVLNNIGLVYYIQKDFETAEKFHQRSLELKLELNDQKGMAFSYNNLGLASQGLNDFNKAMEYFEKALSIRKETNDTREIAKTKSNIGYLKFLTEDFTAANEYLFNALELYKEVDDKSGLAQIYNYLGKVARNRLELNRAQRFFDMSMEISQEMGLRRMIKDNYLEQAKLMAQTRNFEKAYEFQGLYIELRDSLFREDIQQKIHHLQSVYDREMKGTEHQLIRKNEEISSLSLQKHRMLRNFLIAGAIFILALLFLLYNRFLIARNSNKLLKKQKEEITFTNQQLVELNSSLMEQKKKFEELNQQLQLSNQKFKESEKHLIETNATKDKFFSIISHDLRNPFASIVSFSRILKRDIQSLSTVELLELALELDKSVLKINNLLENLLQWSRAQTGKIKYKPEYIAIHEIVKDNLNLFENNAKEKAIQMQDLVDDNLAVWADRNMTDTVIRNLLSNALKYSFTDGLILISSRVENNKAYISVKDNGVGMTKTSKEKIFRSDTLHSTYGTMDEKGSGLGLLLCKEFVEKQGGDITFKSEPDEGATFTFSLPLRPEN
jgi:signal transduction histidine kinase